MSYPRVMLFCAVLVAASGGCDKSQRGVATETSGVSQFVFDLACDSTDTARQSTLFCVRLDTRDGAVLVVDLDRIPTSNGPTQAAVGPAGMYKIACDSTVTAEQSVFRCVRLNRTTGELLTVRLPAVGRFPPP